MDFDDEEFDDDEYDFEDDEEDEDSEEEVIVAKIEQEPEKPKLVELCDAEDIFQYLQEVLADLKNITNLPKVRSAISLHAVFIRFRPCCAFFSTISSGTKEDFSKDFTKIQPDFSAESRALSLLQTAKTISTARFAC